MATKILIEKIASYVTGVPQRADVLRLQQPSTEDLPRQAKRLLVRLAEAFGLPVGPAHWLAGPDHMTIRLPNGAWAQYYYASGAMRVNAGLEPLATLFPEAETQADLTRLIERSAARLNLSDFIGRNETVKFERLWSIKAAASGPNNRLVPPVLCRVVGAYRQFVGDIPVWGPASIALKLAGGGRFDSLALNMRNTTGETIDRPHLIKPARGAANIVLQLETLMGESQLDLDTAATVDWARFGYLSLPARKAQRVFAPFYIASISITGPYEAQGYVLATPATEKIYMPLMPGEEPAAMQTRNASMPPTLRRTKIFDEVGAFGQIA